MRLLSLLLPAALHAQTGSITGTVADSASGEPVSEARVEALLAARPAARAFSDRAGRFTLERLAAGQYLVVIRRIGYEAGRVEATVPAGRTTSLAIRLVPRAITVDPEVITASRSVERALRAPAAVSVVTPEEMERRVAFTPADHLKSLPGVDVVTSGVTQHNVVTRGFNNAGSGQLLTLTDYRYAAVPALRINAYNFIPATNEDVERLEVVRGPGAALYGPNTTAGVLHLITRSPFESQGTSASVAGGERGLFHATLRHAGSVERVGWKLSGQYLRADDWEYLDLDEQLNRINAITGGADSATLLIGRRDPRIERAAGEARVDLRLDAQTTAVASLGLNHAFNNIDITGFGAAQVRDWRYFYAQGRLTRGALFAQVFLNTSDAGETYLLRTGIPISDRSRQLVGQAQYEQRLDDRSTLTYGVDVQRTDPRTGGTIYGRFENDDLTDEVGAYIHAQSRFHGIEAVAALRADYHSRVTGVVLSPRGAVIVEPAAGHSVRITYNRAFSTPTTYDLFLDLLVGSLQGGNTTLPFGIRALGVPRNGYAFQRTCGPLHGGLCMYSPFVPPSLGGPSAPLPADATLLWDVLVTVADTLFGIDLSVVPRPTAADVSSVIRRADIGTRVFEPLSAAEVVDIPGLRHRITNALELGYKGLLSNSVLVTLDLYYSWHRGFLSQQVATPSVFFDAAALRSYLAAYLPVSQAGQVAAVADAVPVGTISPDHGGSRTDLLVMARNFGRLSVWGADLAAAVQVTPELALSGSYSWVSDDVFENVGGTTDIALNAPRNKATLSAGYRNESFGLSGELRARLVQSFPVISGVYQDTVDSYAILDASLLYRLPVRGLSLGVSAQNLLDNRHREFAGVPAIGRLVVGRVRLEL